MDQVWWLKNCLMKRSKERTYIALLDISKAYDYLTMTYWQGHYTKEEQKRQQWVSLQSGMMRERTFDECYMLWWTAHWKKWGAIQQAEEDSKCPAYNAKEETADFLLRCPNLWEDCFRIWSVDNGNEEQVRKLIIEDCTTKLLSSGKKCNRAQEMEQCKQSCKRVWRLWAARASWKHGSSSAFYQSLGVKRKALRMRK